ncbi:hypothetical protein ACFLU8_00925 [Chloroflexota bacterium]
MDLFWLGGQRPKDIPYWAYLYLVNTLKVQPGDISILRSVEKVGLWDSKLVTFVRIYNLRASEEALQVKDFTALDQQPELILYEGYWEKGSDRVYLERKAAPKPQSQ